MNKKQLQKELKNVRNLYVVGVAKGTNYYWDRGIWRKFRLFYVKDGELRQVYINDNEKDYPPYWNEKKGLFECKTLGTSRTFEIVYHLGKWLFNDGYKFKPVFLSWE